MQQISQCQARDENVGPISHALILINDPQKCGVANDPHHKHQAGHHCVDILKCVSDLCGSGAHWRQAATRQGHVRPHRTLQISLDQPGPLGDRERLPGALRLQLLPIGQEHETGQEE